MKGRKGPPRTVIVLTAVAIALFVMVQGSNPEPVNWRSSFTGRDRIPYGTAILREQLPTLAPGRAVQENTQPAYIAAGSFPDSSALLIVNNTFSPDPYDTRELLNYADRGGVVVVVAGEIEQDFCDTLGFDVATDRFGGDTVGVHLVNPAFGGMERGYPLLQRAIDSRMDNYFAAFDTSRSTVLGVNDSGRVNAIAVAHGSGRIIVNLLPYAFTNYALLRRDGFEYASHFLRYLPAGRAVIWDEFYKTGRELVSSPLRYVLAQESLRWAIWLSIVAVVLAVLLLGRRTQRVIPIVAPPANATVQFTETIAQLYQRRADHRDLALKKQTYTLESLRHRYGIGPQVRGEEFVRTLAARAGIERDSAAAMMAAFEWVNRNEEVGESDLLDLARTVDRTVGKPG